MAVLPAQPHNDLLWVIEAQRPQPFRGARADELYQIGSSWGYC